MAHGYNNLLVNNMLYSCVDRVQRAHEQFVDEHCLGYIISGETHVFTAEGSKVFRAGTVGLVKRNQLVKSTKVPPPGGEFRAINIFFDQEILRRYSTEKGIHANEPFTGDPYRLLPNDAFIKGYFDSLLPYFDVPERMDNSIAELKTKEALELVLKIDPSLKNLLFDFSDPYKIDLEAFMLQNYMYNVHIDAFARLTGRSRAGFKRDFQKIFNTSPGLWLKQKRLQEAYHLIRNKGIKPSTAYLDVGFENLSHFSFAFKQAFGVAPSSMIPEIGTT